MKKKYSLIGIALFLVITAVLLTVIACNPKNTSGLENTSSLKDTSAVSEITVSTVSHYGRIENKNAPSEKHLIFFGKDLDLTYAYTNNIKTSLPENRADNYGSYDVYRDSDGREYLFHMNSDTFCGTIKPGVSIDAQSVENPISEEDAKNTANQYISEVYSKETAGQYLFKSCKYDENSGIFTICFVKMISEYMTDDEINVYVRIDNAVVAFSAFYIGRYDRYIETSDKYDFSSAITEIEKNINTAVTTKYSVDKCYFSLNDEGKPIIVYNISYNTDSGTVAKIYEQQINAK